MKFEMYLIAAYSPLCAAVGIDTAQFSGADCYGCATAVMSALKGRARVIVKGSFSETDYMGSVARAVGTELRDLRAKVCK